MVRAPWDDLAGKRVGLVDPTNDVAYERAGDDLSRGCTSSSPPGAGTSSESRALGVA